MCLDIVGGFLRDIHSHSSTRYSWCCSKKIEGFSKSYMGGYTLRSKGITVHWGMIVAFIVLVIGVGILMVFIFKIEGVGANITSFLIDSFKGIVCGAMGGVVGGLIGC